MLDLQQLQFQPICARLVDCPFQILQLEQRNCLRPIFSLLFDWMLHLEYSNRFNGFLHGGIFNFCEVTTPSRARRRAMLSSTILYD
jgi:hypothetical protein